MVMTARILLGWVDPADLEYKSQAEGEDVKTSLKQPRKPGPDLRPLGLRT